VGTKIAPLNVVERGDFRKAEAIIEKNLATFVETGQALLDIREGRLYRESYKTFQSYCQERWGFGSRRAEQLIESADTAASLKGVTTVKLSNEGQARELAGLTEEVAKDILEQVAAEATAAGKPITAAAIKAKREHPPSAENANNCSHFVPEGGGEAAATKKAKTALGQLVRALDELGIEWKRKTLQQIKDALK